MEQHTVRTDSEQELFVSNTLHICMGVAGCESAKPRHDLVDQISNWARDNEHTINM